VITLALALAKRERARKTKRERERESSSETKRERERETSSVNLSPRPSLRVQINASPCGFCARNKKTRVLVSVFERAALRSRVCVSVHVHNLQSQELEGTHEHDTNAIPRRGSEQIERHSWSACTKQARRVECKFVGATAGVKVRASECKQRERGKRNPLSVPYCACDSRGSGDSPLAQRLQDWDESIDVAETSNLRTTHQEIRAFPPVSLSLPNSLFLFNLTAAPTVFMTDAACFFIAGLLYMSGASVADMPGQV
jgi:hypothetical protein